MDRKVVEEELRKGWEAASQFRNLLNTQDQLTEKLLERGECSSNDQRRMECMKNYSNTMLNSFDNSISILKKIVQSVEMKTLLVGHTTNACSSKSRLRTIEGPNLTPDGHAWRKYGQKSILKSKHPREYYRCAYKEDQNCQATKQVQKTSDNPRKYRITYFGHHTCQPILNNNNLVPDSSMLDPVERDFTNIISFDLKNNPNSYPKQDLSLVVPSSSLSSTSINPPPPQAFDSTTILESSLADDIAYLNYPDVLYSPRIFTSPSYMDSSNVQDYRLMVDDSYDMSGVLLDLPLWD